MSNIKKIFKYLAVVSMGALLLTACTTETDKNDTEEAENNELSIAVWNYNGNPEFQGLVEGFKDKNPDVNIEILDIEADSYEDKLTTMLSSKDKTDIMAIKDVPSYSSYASKEQLEDLSDVVENFDDNDIENFKGNLDGYEMDGKYYALPFRKDIYMLFYNKDIFDEQGVDYPENLTWDEYELLAKEMTHEKDGKTIYGSYHHSWDPILLATAANQSGETLANNDYGFAEEYFERWIRMEDEGSTQEYSSIKSANLHYSSEFETEQTAMMIMGSFYPGQLLDRADEHGINWGLTSLPQNDKGKVITYGGPAGIAVSKYSENKELAKAFIEFAAGEEGAKIIAGKVGMTPAYQSDEVLELLLNKEGMPQDEESKQAYYPDINGWELLPTIDAADIGEVLFEEHDLIRSKEISVPDGIKKLSERVSKIINK